MSQSEIEHISERFRAAYNSRDWAAMRTIIADDIVFDDRQPARGFPPVHGADEFIERMQQGVDSIPDRSISGTVLLAERGGSSVVRTEFRGHDPVGGGEVAGDRIAVTVVADGRMSLIAFFEVDDEAAALAYFEALPD